MTKLFKVIKKASLLHNILADAPLEQENSIKLYQDLNVTNNLHINTVGGTSDNIP